MKEYLSNSLILSVFVKRGNILWQRWYSFNNKILSGSKFYNALVYGFYILKSGLYLLASAIENCILAKIIDYERVMHFIPYKAYEYSKVLGYCAYHLLRIKRLMIACAELSRIISARENIEIKMKDNAGFAMGSFMLISICCLTIFRYSCAITFNFFSVILYCIITVTGFILLFSKLSENELLSSSILFVYYRTTNNWLWELHNEI